MNDKEILRRIEEIRNTLYKAPSSIDMCELNEGMAGELMAKMTLFAGIAGAVLDVVCDQVDNLRSDLLNDMAESERLIAEWNERQKQEQKKEAFMRSFGIEEQANATDPADSREGAPDAE